MSNRLIPDPSANQHRRSPDLLPETPNIHAALRIKSVSPSFGVSSSPD